MNKSRIFTNSFVKLLRNSPLIKMGDPTSGKIVDGKVVHIVQDDLYIDFGGKFQLVCPRPVPFNKESDPSIASKFKQNIKIGTKVRVKIRDLELSTRFLGAKTDLTILEADGQLLSVIDSKQQLPLDEVNTETQGQLGQEQQNVIENK